MLSYSNDTHLSKNTVLTAAFPSRPCSWKTAPPCGGSSASEEVVGIVVARQRGGCAVGGIAVADS